MGRTANSPDNDSIKGSHQELQKLNELIDRFSKDSDRLSKWLLGLTAVLVILTGILIWLTYIIIKDSQEHISPQATAQS